MHPEQYRCRQPVQNDRISATNDGLRILLLDRYTSLEELSRARHVMEFSGQKMGKNRPNGHYDSV